MANPLEMNATTGEPFLRLPPSYSNFIITPPRLSDKTAMISALNHPNVSKWAPSIHSPFLDTHAEPRLAQSILISDTVLRELANEASGTFKMFGGVPVRTIREVKEDGSDRYVGEIGFVRHSWPNFEGKRREAMIQENQTKEAGDPTIVWEVGVFIIPSHHNKGIVTASFKVILEKWGIPRMRMRRVRAFVMTDNRGSLGVCDKLGFSLKFTVNHFFEQTASWHRMQLLELDLQLDRPKL